MRWYWKLAIAFGIVVIVAIAIMFTLAWVAISVMSVMLFPFFGNSRTRRDVFVHRRRW